MEESGLAETLTSLCEQKAPVTVMSLDPEALCQGRFRDSSNGLILIDVLHKPRGVEFKTISQCVIVFRSESRGCSVFVAPVIDSDKNTFPETLVVQAPSMVASENRSRFRVPIFKSTAPLVEISCDESTLRTPNPLNISLTGILVEFPGAEVPELSIDTELWLEIRFEETGVGLKGVVRRRENRRYGIFFPEVLQGIHMDPPDALKRIVRRLETIWLQQRVY